MSPFPTRGVFTLKQRERLSAFTLPKLRERFAFTLLSNFRFPVSGLRSPVSKFSTSYFVISASQRERARGACRAVALREGGFTLLESLVVIGIVAILMVLIAPAFTYIKGGTDVTSAAYTIKGVLDQARTYAKANNTYTWVGFYEENSTANTPTNTAPPYSGVGRVLLASVSSTDGTKIYDESSDPAAQLPNNRISQVGKLMKIEGVHITDIGTPTGGSSDTLNGRSNLTYTSNFNRVSSDSANATKFSFAAQGYTFYKAIRFSPSGEANLLYQGSTYALTPVGEIGIKPTHGTVVDGNTPNVVAIQFTGIGSNVTIYRK